MQSGDTVVPFTAEEAEGFFQTAPEPYLLVDQEGVILRGNTQAEMLLGYPQSELRNMPVETLVPEHLRKAHRGFRLEYMEQPTSYIMGKGKVLSLQCKNGIIIPVEISIVPLISANGYHMMLHVRRLKNQRVSQRRTIEILQVISGRNPYQVWLMGFLMFATIPLIFKAAPSLSVQSLVPHWAVAAWAIAVSGACLANIVGVYWRRSYRTSIYLEIGSGAVLTIGNLLYPVALIVYALARTNSVITPASVWSTVVLLAAISGCSAGRVWQLTKARREVNAVEALAKMSRGPRRNE